MSAGYVYILINQAMPGLIKVGRTFRDSRERARELHTTGVPTPFEVAFELFSLEHERVEEALHQRLNDYRVSPNREFFRFPLRDAINMLLEINSSTTNSSEEYVAESIFDKLIQKYPNWLKSSIKDVRIVQTSERVWLEITEEEDIAGYLKNQIIKRSDLAFIVADSGSDPLFRASDHVSANARKFVDDFDAFSIIQTTDLFHEAACQEVNEKLNPHRSHT